jgi:hypothetical protein
VATRGGYYPEPADTEKELQKSPQEMRATLEANMYKAALSSISYNGLNATVTKDTPGIFELGITGGAIFSGPKWTEPNTAR